MKLFGQIVRTAVNVVALPVAAAADLSGLSVLRVADGKPLLTQDAIRRLKDEADEKPRSGR